MPVARLPLTINSEFLSIREALEAAVTMLNEGIESSFTFAFFSVDAPRQTFYVQAKTGAENSEISIEAQRVADTEDLLLRAQDLKARVLGWKVPKVSDENPNYHQTWNFKTASARRIAEEMVEALKFLGHVSPDSWMSATPAELHETLRNSNLFWTKNGDSEFLCQRGFNIRTTIEGLKATTVLLG
jgi:hypothetical protein